MAGFTIMMAVRSVFIMRFRKINEDITTSNTTKIENCIIAIILSGESIRNTLGRPGNRKIGGNDTQEGLKKDQTGFRLSSNSVF
jgi:hypothetical protein